jgi:hypothetical protein
MSTQNPYDKYIGGRDLDEILSSSAVAIQQALTAIGDEKLSVPIAPGKWSPAQIVAHLADCEVAFGFRLRQTLTEDAPVLQPFDQDKWAQVCSDVSAGEALAAFAAARAWNVQLLRKALPAAASKAATHPERGTMTFLTIVETMAGHDLNHLAQLQRIAAA